MTTLSMESGEGVCSVSKGEGGIDGAVGAVAAGELLDDEAGGYDVPRDCRGCPTMREESASSLSAKTRV